MIKININKNECIEFPFGGIITRKDIYKRLKILKITNSSVIHLDLYNTDQIQLMNEFLFSILITKFYKNKGSIYYLWKRIKIKVEIPNSFIDFFSKFPILSLFKRNGITIKNLPSLVCKKELYSNDQIVANYLKVLKESNLDNVDLNFPTLTPMNDNSKNKLEKLKNKFKYKIINAEVISDEECNNLIIEALKKSNNIKYPSHYQINTFINILGSQLSQFSKNHFFSAYNILPLNDNDLKSIRTDIINNFINITKYFTQSSFDYLLKKQTIFISLHYQKRVRKMKRIMKIMIY